MKRVPHDRSHKKGTKWGARVDEQIPEQANELGISELEVIKNVMLKETVDGEFTTVEDAAERPPSSWPPSARTR